MNRWGKLVTVRQCFNAVVKVVAASPPKNHCRHFPLSVAYRQDLGGDSELMHGSPCSSSANLSIL